MKEKYLSQLVFDNYLVVELSYKQNNNFSFGTESLSVDFDAMARVQLTEGDEAAVTLKVVCGNEDDEDCPFSISVEVLGIFKFDGDRDTFEQLVTSNAIAILFPYVRSLVSDLSSRSNVFPQYQLPLLNIVEFVKDNDNLEVENI